MKFRKITALCATFFMCAAFMTGCGDSVEEKSSGKSEEKVKTSVSDSEVNNESKVTETKPTPTTDQITEPETETVSDEGAETDENADEQYENLLYRVDNNEIIITGCVSDDITSIEIPSEIFGVPVTTIADQAFSSKGKIESISIPDSVVKVEGNAFGGTAWLKNKQKEEPVLIENNILLSWDPNDTETEIVIPDGVKSIASYAFAFVDKNNITSVTLPDSLMYICSDAFSGHKNLSTVIMPDSVVYIGSSAFSLCNNLTDITIPNSVKYIGNFAFSNTQWLKTMQEKDPLVIINSILIDATLCEGEVTIPDNVTKICIAAFLSSPLNSVIIPENVGSIDYSTFFECKNLKEITFLNPECEINPDEGTICNRYNVDNDKCEYNGVIIGYKNSTAQEYAERNGYKFLSLD